MTKTSTLPRLILATALVAAVLGGCRKEDSGVGGDGDAAAVTNPQSGVVGDRTTSDSVAGSTAVDMRTNNTPRTVGEPSTEAVQASPGAIGGASGVGPGSPSSTTPGAGPGLTGSSGTSGLGATGTGGSPQAGATVVAPPGAETGAAQGVGTKASGHTGDTSGTGPASTKAGAGR